MSNTKKNDNMGSIEVIGLWLSKNVPWIGYVLMSILGGIVAHVRDWETRNPGYTFKQHVWALVRRTIMAVLAGAMWYLLMKENEWEARPYAYVGASLVGLFAPEFFDFLWGLLKDRVGKK